MDYSKKIYVVCVGVFLIMIVAVFGIQAEFARFQPTVVAGNWYIYVPDVEESDSYQRTVEFQYITPWNDDSKVSKVKFIGHEDLELMVWNSWNQSFFSNNNMENESNGHFYHMNCASLWIDYTLIPKDMSEVELNKAILYMNNGKVYEVDFGKIILSRNSPDERSVNQNFNNLNSNWEVFQYLSDKEDKSR